MEHVHTKVRQLFGLEDKEEDNLIWAPYALGKFRTAQKLVLSLSQSDCWTKRIGMGLTETAHKP